MFTLQKLNVVKVTADERRRDSLLAQGFTLLHVETEEPAAAPVAAVVAAIPEPAPKPKRAQPRKRTR